MIPDAHVPTNISIIENFLPVRFHLTQGECGRVTLILSS